jgi:hypothetical protein
MSVTLAALTELLDLSAVRKGYRDAALAGTVNLCCCCSCSCGARYE